MSNPDYYALLGVTENAGYLEIKSAYREQAKQYHPDRIQNPSPVDQERFSRIAEAYSVLSDLKRRRAYDDFQHKEQAQPWYTRPHYSGYPYFQWDIFTPAMHTFFMGHQQRQNNKETLRTTFLNGKTLMVSLLGALIFFKFFSVMDGTVLEKKIDTGLFQNISYKVIVKTSEGKEKKKRIKAELFDMLEKDDHIEKQAFSFTFKVNGKEVQPVTSSRFLLQIFMIYGVISCGLFVLEYGRT
ncbi:MAG: J domain-containing protein [Nitrospina sp.]|jgi:curved DNA-binding protein CbpA|nr:J domain-containing protein [Nitrospina sp.]MBT3509781.1 J domain-containing protein [Nitrospina sp.]MBT3874880.1 J domain-containing protein [Nitrospina sp.]MBT4049779.1 J domain-containing protein [Nitrospina sp.]MBT4558739.1 J domain-containing protein [Nitrospina sp.]